MISATLTLLLLAAAPPTFADTVKAGKLTFTAPKGFTEVPVIKNEAMSYDVAFRDPTKTLEIRIAVRLPSEPLPPPKAGEKRVVISDDKVFPALVQATMLNLTNGSNASAPKAFSERAVKKEFFADQGFTSFVEPKAEGWTSAKNCMLYAVRKADAAEVYVFFLFDEFPPVSKVIESNFHLIKFTPSP